MSVRVLIVDDQALVRAGFRMILESEPEIEIVGEAGNGIAGMRARAAALGGTLTAGPVAGGGWRVEAVLPDTGESDS